MLETKRGREGREDSLPEAVQGIGQRLLVRQRIRKNHRRRRMCEDVCGRGRKAKARRGTKEESGFAEARWVQGEPQRYDEAVQRPFSIV